MEQGVAGEGRPELGSLASFHGVTPNDDSPAHVYPLHVERAVHPCEFHLSELGYH